MKKIWTWLKEHWYVPLAFLAGIFIILFSRRDTTTAEVVKDLNEADSKTDDRLAEEDKRHSKESNAIGQREEKEVVTARDEVKEEYDALKKNPSALARKLVSLGSKNRPGPR